MQRDVSTVRRWEKREGLPVHRHSHEHRDSVYAYPAEIDSWWDSRRNTIVQNGTGSDDAKFNGDTASLDKIAEPRRHSRAATWAWVPAATFFVTTLGLAIFLLRQSADIGAGALERRFQIPPPPGMSFRDHVISPDARHLAFTAAPKVVGGKGGLWVQPADSLEARLLPDTEDAALPFWSPTSDAVGFFAAGKLWTVDLAGGGPRSVADAPDARGGAWNRAGTIVFAPEPGGPLYRVALTGGTAMPVTRLGEGESGHVWPAFLPDGNRFLFLADTPSSRPEDHHVFAGALDGRALKRVTSLASSIAYVPDGYLLYQRERRLFAQPFDAGTLQLTGEAVALADRVQQRSGFNHGAEFSASLDSVLTFRAQQSPANRLVWHDRTHRLSTLVSSPAEYQEPALSPDGSRVAFGVFDPQLSQRYGYGIGLRSDIFIFDRSTGTSSQLTTDPALDSGPVWSPDGRTIVFSSNRSGTIELLQIDATGASRDVVVLPSTGNNPVAQSWSPNGRFLLYGAFDPRTRMDLWLLPMVGNRTPIPLLRSEFNEEQGQISPDGRWFAYISAESGRDEVYVSTFPTPTTKWRVSSDGGGDPRWRRDGKELFYITKDRRLMAVAIKAGTTIEHGDAVALFDTGVPPHWYEARNLYDVSRDGRFLFMSPVEDDRSLPVTVVVNWAARFRKQEPRNQAPQAH